MNKLLVHGDGRWCIGPVSVVGAKVYSALPFIQTYSTVTGPRFWDGLPSFRIYKDIYIRIEYY